MSTLNVCTESIQFLENNHQLGKKIIFITYWLKINLLIRVILLLISNSEPGYFNYDIYDTLTDKGL